MELFKVLKFRRNSAVDSTPGDVNVLNLAPKAEEDSYFDLVLTGAEFDNVGVIKNNSNISSRSVHIKSIDNDTYQQHQHNNNTGYKLSKRNAQAKSNRYNCEVFSTRKILPIETNSKPHSPISTHKSPPKFRVFMFRKSSSLEKIKYNNNSSSSSSSMRFRFEEVPVIANTVLGRENSLRGKLQRESCENSLPANESFNREIGVQKYLKMIKPLYVKASKIRIFEKSLSLPRKQAEEKHGSRSAVFRDVCRNLVKSRSAVGVVPVPANRRDDSVLEQQDGIQSAILHCKRSYSSSSSSSSIISQECTMLSRSASESSYQKALNPPRNSTEEEK